MIESTALLRKYLRALRELSGAACVSLYAPASASGESESALLHDGDLSPVPELENESSAERLLSRIQKAQSTPWPRVPTEVDSEDPDCLLLSLPVRREASDEGREGDFEERRRTTTEPSVVAPVAWLGLRYPLGDRPQGSSPIRAAAGRPGDGLDSEADPEDPAGWNHLLDLAGLLAGHATQISSKHQDRTTGLPDRREFQALLDAAIDTARRHGQHLALLWVNPDDFVRLNELFGNESGDRVVGEIADRLRHLLRAQDLVARYGGVTFAVILRGTAFDSARSIADRILQNLSGAAYLDGATRLDFSIGLAVFEPEDERIQHSLDLVRRADQALSAAKHLGGGTIVSWEEKLGVEQMESFDRMAGIFTGDVAKDYRNMMVLWDTVNVVAKHDDLDLLATEALGRLFEVLKPDRIGLFGPDPDGNLVLLRGLTRRQGESGGHLQELAVDEERTALMVQAMEEGIAREALLPGKTSSDEPSEPSERCCAVPLIAGGAALGALFIEWKRASAHLDASDLVFLNGLGLQLAMAWDRVRLVELEISHQELEKRQLRAELKELRRVVRQAKLVYRSPEMERIMRTARRVARSDATILIAGPSGTGKELIARSVHQLSDRRDKPFVIVDCGAIPTTLIESELFGYERGAYTGAQQRRRGRLAEAHQGTVLLDEIGEVPLEVQSKLLRFVQEKQFTSVGGSGSRTVDVRILAATNRDLLAEAVAGRFREDLYYRLNVVQLSIPPLKDRHGDVIHLAQHFLELYAGQYQRNIRGLTPEAGQCLLDHSWPGNVRELQNRIMQAVLLCEGSVLTPQDLGLAAHEPGIAAAPGSGADLPVSQPATLELPATPAAAPPDPTRAAASPAAPPAPPPIGSPGAGAFEATGTPPLGVPGSGGSTADGEEVFQQLARDLHHQIAAIATSGSADLPPLGRWLSDELLLAADRSAGGVRDRGAAILDLAPSTYRRRLEKARSRRDSRTEPRPPGWERISESSQRLVDLAASPPGLADLPGRCERALLAEIIARYPGQTRIGSALLGVTAPTFRRRVAALRQAP